MHIKHIHDMVEKLSECAKCEMDKGIKQIDAKEMGEVAEIIKELCEAEYYAKISKAMDESEYGEDYDYMGAYDEERKGYRGQPRSQSGRFMSRGDGRRSNRGRGGRRGYDEPMYFTMTPEMYREHDPEYYRDMDREIGKMYYSGGSGSSGGSMGGSSSSGTSGGSMGSQGGQSSGGSSRGYEEGYSRGYEEGSRENQRDGREGRSGRSRRSYMETKEMNKGNSSEEKQMKMKELEKYMKELSEDVTEMIGDASPEEKSMLKTKLQTLTQKI